MNYDQGAILNQEPGQMAISDKDKIVAGILGIVVGGLGIHRMYMGYIGLGILQLILTIITFGIAGLWGFIEGILILVQDNWTDSQGRLLIGNDNRLVIPLSAFLGGLFVVSMDFIARVLFASVDIRVGVLMSLIGGPFFIFLIFKNNLVRR